MNKGFTAALVLAANLSVGIGAAQQPTAADYYRVEFIKAKPGKLIEYEAFLKKNVPAISQANIKEGKLVGWSYSRVVTPTGTSVNHDLLGIYAYDKWEQLEPAASASDAVKVAMKTLGFTSPEDYAAKRDPLRDIVRSEIWHRAAGTTRSAATTSREGEYVVVSFLKPLPGNTTEYLDMWKKYSLPLQEDRVKAGKLKSYSMWTVGGSGTGANYDIVSLARYGTFKEINPADGGNNPEADQAAERIHAGKDWRQMRRDMSGLRTVWRTEIIHIMTRVP